MEHTLLSDSRFAGLAPSPERLWLSSPTMHGEELEYIQEAIRTNWVSTIGANIQEAERLAAETIGRSYAVALSSGTAALHLAVKLCGERLYGQPRPGHGTLEGRRVFCSDMTFAASINPVAQEGGEAVLLDAERETWNLDPAALERAFEAYPDTRLAVMVHLYGTPAKIHEIRAVCDRHHALIVEDAAESLGAAYRTRREGAAPGGDRAGAPGQVRQTGTFGDVSIISFNGNKIVTGSTGGMLLTDRKADADKARKWSTQSREAAPWYQHEELGFNYRMSNIVAGIVRGQLPHLREHIERKRAIYERYRDGLRDLPVRMNPFESENAEPNYWLSCLLIDREAMCRQVRSGREALYLHEAGKSCPSEILDVFSAFNIEGRPIWKPMHMQPYYRMNPFFTAAGGRRADSNAYIAGSGAACVSEDIFARGLCLPSDNKMTPERQDFVIELIRRCFR